MTKSELMIRLAESYLAASNTQLMAKDVEQALLDIIAEHGNMSPDDADEYLSELRENKRYQRDVY